MQINTDVASVREGQMMLYYVLGSVLCESVWKERGRERSKEGINVSGIPFAVNIVVVATNKSMYVKRIRLYE